MYRYIMPLLRTNKRPIFSISTNKRVQGIYCVKFSQITSYFRIRDIVPSTSSQKEASDVVHICAWR